MHEDTERRRLQPFGPASPLLERQIGPVGWRNRARTELFGRSAVDAWAPCVEGFFEFFRLSPAPPQKRRPGRPTRLANEQHGFRGIAGGAGWRSLAVAERKPAAQDEA